MGAHRLLRLAVSALLLLALATTACQSKKSNSGSDGGAVAKDGAYQVTCEWSPAEGLRVSEAKAWGRYDLKITVKGEPADLLVFAYGPDGKLVFGDGGYDNKITADEMRLSRVGLKTVPQCETEGTYTVMVRKQGSDEVIATAKVTHKGKGG